MGADRRAEFYHKETFSEFIWNPETKAVFGRTGSSWGKIFIFYVVFYSCLAGFWAIMLTAFYQTLDTQHMPKYTPGGGGSILRHPSLGFRPLPRKENIESTLIWYRQGHNEDIKQYTDSLDHFIQKYEDGDGMSGQHMVDCSESNPPSESEVCRFRDTWLSDKCKKSEHWGFNRGTPCFLLKMNRMINWVPDVYESEEELDENMPASLKETIKEQKRKNNGIIPKMVWVSCTGENAADEEYIGPIEYSPNPGFPAYYFPFKNIPGYLPPIVAVQFNKTQSHVLINIECRVWAKNIHHDRKHQLGLVHFELLRD